MRILVLSDIHGNLHALEAVLEAAGEVDALWNLGDTVGYGARPNEVVARMRELAAINVRGNHDRVCCGLSSSASFNPAAAAAATWTFEQLREENLEWLRKMPQGPVLSSPHTLCAHGSPLHEDQYIVSMRDAWLPLQRMEAEITFFGHTHVQGGFSICGPEWEEMRPTYESAEGRVMLRVDLGAGTRHLINPGSVGQPRDEDWRAAYLIYDTTDGFIEYHRTPYDVEAAQTAIRVAGLPDRLAARLSFGR